MTKIQLKLTVSALTLLFAHAEPTLATDACSARAIVTKANVTVSDGSSFQAETFFHSTDASAIRHLLEQPQLIVLEGPVSWTEVGDKVATGLDFHKLFALGHQYHAMLLHFGDFVKGATADEVLQFAGRTAQASTGDFLHGGTLSLVSGEDESRPLGVVQMVPEGPTVESEFLDWREVNGTLLPHQVRINDGERVFDYRYTSIEVAERSPLWFFETVHAPSLDSVQLYRLHRTLLAAHCLGDAELIAELSTPEMLLATRGELMETTRQEVFEQFQSVFNRIVYNTYSDITLPRIQVAESGDLAWMGVNVRLTAKILESGDDFAQQWAWVMLARKIDGQWLHAGNGSSFMPPEQ